MNKTNKLIFTSIFLSTALVFAYTCSAKNIACSYDGDCGANSYTGSPICQQNSSYQSYTTYTCNNPGLTSSYCSSSKVFQLKNSNDASCANNPATSFNAIIPATNAPATPAAPVVVTQGQVLGASTVSTGLTNNIWVDSFFLPLLFSLIGIFMLKSGMLFPFEKWLDALKKQRRGYKAEKELNARIAQIKKTGTF
ncbi:MAG: hypothetical protein ABSA74_01845 [Candidatus Staskawiczbacteria bacterium]|jgi:hypothetical protein